MSTGGLEKATIYEWGEKKGGKDQEEHKMWKKRESAIVLAVTAIDLKIGNKACIDL